MATGQLSGVLRHLRRVALLRDGGGMTDGQLLESFLTQQDEAAFDALVRRHGPMVLGVCRRILRHAHDAEDAFQATFLVLVRKAASITQRELLGNWLYGVAYRTALEAKAATIRRRRRERQVSAMPEPEAPETEVWHDLRPLLDQELSRLADKYRVPVVLCDLEGRTRREVARHLGISEGTLSGRLTTARRRLAKRLARQGLTLSGGALAAVLSPSAASAGVPSALVVSTVKAATAVAAGQAAAGGVISFQVAALTEGVCKAMLLTKLKVTAILLLALGALAVSTGTFADRVLSAQAAGPQKEPTPPATPAGEVPTKEAAQVRADAEKATKVTVQLRGAIGDDSVKALRKALEKVKGIKFKADDIRKGKEPRFYSEPFVIEIADIKKTDIGAIAKAAAAADTPLKDELKPGLMLLLYALEQVNEGSFGKVRDALVNVNGVDGGLDFSAADAAFRIRLTGTGEAKLGEVLEAFQNGGIKVAIEKP